MKPVAMSLRSLWVRKWVSLLTLTSLALGIALPSAILRIRAQVDQSLLKEGKGIDLVVGAKGSPLQLILSSVHHLDMPTGNIPWSMVEEVRANPRVTQVLPIGLGDNVDGFRIVGTDHTLKEWVRDGDVPLATLEAGTWFEKDFEAVLGSEVAKQTGLGLGDSFTGVHGLVADFGAGHEEFPYRVTGILSASQSAVDRLIFTPIGSVWKVHEEDRNQQDQIFQPGGGSVNQDLEITALWVRLRSPGYRMWIREEINENTVGMAASPLDQMLKLSRGVIRPLQDVLLVISAVVVLVSSLAIFSTLLQSAQHRQRDWALLRILGAHSREIFWLVWLEALWLTGAGILLGYLLSTGGLSLAAGLTDLPVLQGLSIWKLVPGEKEILFIIMTMGALAGILPAFTAYRKSPLGDVT